MVATIIDGKEIAKRKRENLKLKVSQLMEQGIQPGLAVVLVGNDPASLTYVRHKQKACKEVGIKSYLHTYDETLTESELLSLIDKLNKDKTVDGILVQLPLPKHISPQKVIEAIHPDKDVDGFHPMNVGRLSIGQEAFLPCTPFGILEMLKEMDIPIAGKHAVIVGRSNIVGKPLGQLLLNHDATVTYCHSKTKDLQFHTRQADLLIVATGKQNLISKEDVKDGVVVIDVGMNRDKNGKLCGDVNFLEVKEKASYITPVPGGVGPMTIAMLLSNTVQAAIKRYHGLGKK